MEDRSDLVAVERPVSMAWLIGTDPKSVYKRASDLAKAASEVIEKFRMYKIIPTKHGPSKHIKLEGWQAVGTPLGLFARVDSVEVLGDGHGYRAKASIVTLNGTVISSATASCSRDENNWDETSGKDDYALESMAQTRACSKAYRMILSWIPQMAGFEPTAAEEMHDERPEGGMSKSATKKTNASVDPDAEGKAIRQETIKALKVYLSHRNDKGETVWPSDTECRELLKHLTGTDSTKSLAPEVQKNLVRALRLPGHRLVYPESGKAQILDRQGAIVFQHPELGKVAAAPKQPETTASSPASSPQEEPF